MSIRSALKQRFASVAVVGLLCSGAAITVVSPSANAVVGGGLFTAITPVRALDTRQSTPILAGETRHLVVAGLFGIPATASAVALNLTAVSPTSDSYLTIWPMGLARPDTSSLNVGAGQVRPNAVIVQLNNGGIDIFNFAGSTHALVDVNGWFSSGATADGGFVGLAPTRLLDTRTGIGRNGTAPVPAGASFNLQVGGRGGVPTSGVSAVVLNVTGTSPTATTYVTVWPSGGVLPGVSSLNLVTGETAANMVMVPVSVTGMVSLYNQLGSVHLIADVMGYFTAGTPGPGGFVPVAPVRVFDSRSLTSIPGRGWRAVKAGGVGSIPASGVGAIAANFTVTGPTADSFLSAFPTAAGTSTTGFVDRCPNPSGRGDIQ